MLKWLRSLLSRLRARLGWRRSYGSLSYDDSTDSFLSDSFYHDSLSGQSDWSSFSPLAYSPRPIVQSSLCKSVETWGRPRLPHPQQESRPSLWAILKKCCGKEFYRLAMPVEINEPLSFLQRLCETMEYADLLEMAAEDSSPLHRMQFVAAFAVASLSSNLQRLRKPFNPILGETYELDRVDEMTGCFRVICEQVSHHPPVSALYAESGHGTYEVECSVNPRLIFWGRSIEIKPQGSTEVRFPKIANEKYVWNSVDCRLHNILIGQMYLEQCGVQVVECKQTGFSCRIRYLPSKTAEKMHWIEGEIVDRTGKTVSRLTGNWSKEVFFSEHGPTALWTVEPRPADSEKYYNFTAMAMALNEMPSMRPSKRASSFFSRQSANPEDDAHFLAPTDSRFRKDIRLLEQGDLDGAINEKSRLEEKQREARKMRSEKGKPWKPMWFSQVSDETWTYRGDFWDRKSTAQYPDLF